MKWLVPIILIIGLVGCSGSKISPQEQIVLLDSAIEATAKATEEALDQGWIDVKRACEVHEYGRLAASILDQAWAALLRGDYDGIEDYIQQARNALEGLADDLTERVNYHCAGVA